MTEAVTAIEFLSGKHIMILAPSSASVEVLRMQGFVRANTLQQFELNPELQQAVKEQVLWVDEAGFLSVEQMLKLQEFAVEHNCRLVVTGDTKQHHSVQRGDALRILERSGAIAQATLTKIYRQQIPELREAIEDLSKGRAGDGFDKLDKLGIIQEIAEDDARLAAIAEKEIEALKAQRSSLIIAPTHGECRAIAGAVRKAMQEKGLLLNSEHSVTRLQRLNLTDAQQRDAVTYEPGQIVEFHKIAKGASRTGVQEKRFKSGEQWEVLRREEGSVIVGRNGVEKHLPLDEARKFAILKKVRSMAGAVRSDLSVLGRGRLVGLPVLYSQRQPLFLGKTNTLSLLAAWDGRHCGSEGARFLRRVLRTPGNVSQGRWKRHQIPESDTQWRFGRGVELHLKTVNRPPGSLQSRFEYSATSLKTCFRTPFH
jgi:hypothetical protein